MVMFEAVLVRMKDGLLSLPFRQARRTAVQIFGTVYSGPNAHSADAAGRNSKYRAGIMSAEERKAYIQLKLILRRLSDGRDGKVGPPPAHVGRHTNRVSGHTEPGLRKACEGGRDGPGATAPEQCFPAIPIRT
ncbi:hypothetical protein Purlil1_13620 [Purpureocillium lilacinum]|uniref:Uncharacterized protein n=1 Tax=Purpureocillium lilacinum TaxID=33203 RepID=A0ABR0BDJ9_PURLI|nr:hypothetical protein Purlil1_13620 [Purpureocillium lilacinum]